MIEQSIIIELILTTLFVWGVYKIFDDGGLLGFISFPIRLRISKIRNERLNNFLNYITKPIFNCVACMSSIWGTAFLLLIGKQINVELLLLIICVVGLSTIIELLIIKHE